VQDAAGEQGPSVIAVGFSPPEALAAVAVHVGWEGRFLADTERRLYSVLGLDRVPWWRVYSPGTLAIYARARAQGHQGQTPVEDTRQLGGDAVLRNGTVVLRWNPRRPDDRVPARDVVDAARAVAAAGRPDSG